VTQAIQEGGGDWCSTTLLVRKSLIKWVKSRPDPNAEVMQIEDAMQEQQAQVLPDLDALSRLSQRYNQLLLNQEAY
jgi:hypothetical protein